MTVVVYSTIPPHSNLTAAGKQLLLKLRADDIKLAWKRYWMLFPEQAPFPVKEECCEQLAASLRARWMEKYREGETKYGDGVLGLVTPLLRRGKSLPRAQLQIESRKSSQSEGQEPRIEKEDTGRMSLPSWGNNVDEVRRLATGTIVRQGNVTTHRMEY